MSTISVKFLVDKEKKRVVFAEAGKDFLDVLCSFLTLPMGKIVRLLGKQSGLGSFDSLYESVEQLDAMNLQTEACKEMLLNPRSAAAMICEDLKIKNIHDANPRGYYICTQSVCLVGSTCYYTRGTKGICSLCGKLMDSFFLSTSQTAGEIRGAFLNDIDDFIITDDLHVMPNSLMRGYSVLDKLQIEDASSLEEKVVDFGTEEALKLLRSSLASKNALTEVVFSDACIESCVKHFSMTKEEIDGSQVEQNSTMIKEEIDVSEAKKMYNVKIILNKKNNNALYAEVGGDFADQLLSLLAFPLGSVFRLLGNHMAFEGCINNLHSSVKSMGSECFKSEKDRQMLVSPKLASYYRSTNQILNLDEMTSNNWNYPGMCGLCWKENAYTYGRLKLRCKHGIRETKFIEQNPKLKNRVSDSGGTFVKDFRRFMITDNLHISPLSSISAIIDNNQLSSNLVEMEVSLDEAKVLSMLNAMLTSKAVLTDVFSPKPTKPRRSHYSPKPTKWRRSQYM